MRPGRVAGQVGALMPALPTQRALPQALLQLVPKGSQPGREP